MTDSLAPQETFSEFKNSFSYGSRTDLNFKFLKGLSDEAATAYLQELLWKLGDALVDGDFARIRSHIRDGQVQSYSAPGPWAYDDAPFTPMRKPVAQARLALVASSGHFVAGRDPEPFGVKDMTQAEAARRIDEFLREAPALTEIPFDTPPALLRVRHGGYDIRAAQADPNVVLPLAHLTELQREGAIGELLPHAYSFVGAAAQRRLLKETAPHWAELLKRQHVDGALLVPA
ncbi:MAG: hypothetical protein HZB53_14005 [Chloroflexi bacterium]|nr:hypothetical protein [Chloroflexota bacterium]